MHETDLRGHEKNSTFHFPEDVKWHDDHHPAVLRILAHLFSVVLHPLFIPSYVAAYLIYIHPYAFSNFDEKAKAMRLISVVLLTAFFPAFTVFLLKRLGFANSVYLRTQKERIIPYVSSMFYFFWTYYVSKNLPSTPPLFTTMLLGVFISSIGALMANIYYKVSMHAIAMGGMFAFFLVLALLGSTPVTIYLTIVILISGLVCTARLIVSDHFPFDIYSGFLIGLISQTIAIFFI
jgi:hypothetical protein